MSIEKLSPNMRSCILGLQTENVVNIECKIENKSNTRGFINIIKGLFK
jgi:hypothetical protein